MLKRFLSILLVVGAVACAGQPEYVPSLTGERQNWLAPNNGSRDLMHMFTRPDMWPVALERVNVFSMYVSQMSNDGGCFLCEFDNYENLKNVVPEGPVKWLNDRNIKFAMEAGGLKWFSCGKSRYVSGPVIRAIRNAQSKGGKVSYISMDEPLYGGMRPVVADHNIANIADHGGCGYTLEQTVDETLEFIRSVNAEFPDVQVGDIEPYPAFSVKQIENFVEAMEKAGYKFPFFHLDFDIGHALSISADTNGDIKELQRFFKEKGIPFGVIVIGADGLSNESFSAGYLRLMAVIDKAIGLSSQDHIIVQSWSDYPPMAQTRDTRWFPDNLPEAQPGTLTYLFNYTLDTAGL